MADIVTGQIFVDAEKGITAAKMNNITSSAVIQPAFYTSKPIAGTADPTDIALILKSGAYAQVPVSTLGGSATQAQIWSTRLRSFNAIGNPNFEVDQRNAGAGITNVTNGVFLQDRWFFGKNGTMVVDTGGYQSGAITLPGTSFNIANGSRSFTLTTAQASLAAGNLLYFHQLVEGSCWRELAGDVSSISLLVYTTVAGLQFSVFLRSSDTAVSLVKLCTIPTASTWTLIQLSNIPKPTGGVFSINAGSLSYYLGVCLAAGSTFLAPAADTWQNGNFLGAPGMSNFAGSPVNSKFFCAFLQHEPGSVCSTLMDKPFSQNLDECQRYYAKSSPYAVGTPTNAGAVNQIFLAGGNPWTYLSYKKTMAKIPTLIGYSTTSGAANTVRDGSAGADKTVTAANVAGDSGFGGFTVTSPNASNWVGSFQYSADTGW